MGDGFGVETPRVGSILDRFGQRLTVVERKLAAAITRARLEDLGNVGGVRPAAGQALRYNAAAGDGRWESGPPATPVFSFDGPLTVTTIAVCAPWDFDDPWTSSFAKASLTATGSSSGFGLYRDGSLLATITASTGATSSGSVTFVYSFAPGNRLQVACTTAGSGAGYATIKVW